MPEGRPRLRAAPVARWLVALAIVGLLLARLSWREVAGVVSEGPVALLCGYVALQALVILLADSLATGVLLQRLGLPRRLAPLLVARGASYVLGLLGYLASQGGLGLYLHRSGAAAGRATAAVALLVGSTLLVTLGLAALGFAWSGGVAPLRPWVAGGAVLVLLYLGGVAAAPRFLARLPLGSAVLELGRVGHLASLAARVPHVLAVALGHWGALRLWGIEVPFAEGVALMPVVLLVVALPVAPGGLGTSQAAQMLLFAPYAAGATAAAREAEVVGFALAYHALGVGFQVLLGLACLPALGRALAASRTPPGGAVPPAPAEAEAARPAPRAPTTTGSHAR